MATGGFFANLTFINVLYILIFSWFVLQLAASTGFPHLPEMSGIRVKSGKSVNSLELTSLFGKCLENNLLKKLQKISRQAFTWIYIFFFLTVFDLCETIFVDCIFWTCNHLSTQFYSTLRRHEFTNILKFCFIEN